VLKALSWRALGTLDTFAISWFFTGRVEIAGSIAGLEIITKVACITFTSASGRSSLGPALFLMMDDGQRRLPRRAALRYHGTPEAYGTGEKLLRPDALLL